MYPDLRQIKDDNIPMANQNAEKLPLPGRSEYIRGEVRRLKQIGEE